MALTHAAARGRHRQDRAARIANPLNAGLLAVLANGPKDTDELMAATGLSLWIASQRLQRLKATGIVRIVGRRRKRRAHGVAYVGVWELLPDSRPESECGFNPRIAGRITIGRGARWGAGLV